MPLIPSFDDVGKATERLQLTVAFLKHSRRETLIVFVALVLVSLGSWLWLTDTSPVPFPLNDDLWRQWAPKSAIAAFGLGGLAFAWVVWRFWRRLGPPPSEPITVQAPAIKGPLSFGPQDGDLFLRLGRQAEIGELLGHVLDDQTSLVVVRGESGAGKTSLLRAGLPRALEGQNPPVAWHYWEALPDKPAARLLAAIRQSWTGPADPPKLDQLTDLDALPGRHVIVLDQFEQLDRHDASHAPIFQQLKHALTEATPPHHTTWIVAYRRAYDPDWRDFEQDELAGHEHKERMLAVRLFRENQARDVIAVISDAAGFTLDTSLVGDLLASMRNDKGLIAPVDIAITLLALNEHAKSHPDKSIGKAELAPSGGATGLLADYVERQLDRFSDDERSTVYAMLLELADLDNDRRLPEGLGLDQLAAAVGRPASLLKPYLQRLAAPNVRLLEILPTGAWRLPHERLIPALRRLSGRVLAEADQARRILDRGFAAWLASDRSRRLLLAGTDLRSVLRHGRQLVLGGNDGDKLAFIQASRRRQLQWQMAAGLALLVATAGSYGAFEAYRDEQYRRNLTLWDLPRALYDRQDELLSLSIDNDRMERLDWLPTQLHQLNLDASRVESLHGLAGLDRLITLALRLSLWRASGFDLQPLAALDGLSSLNLEIWSTSITGFDLQPLAALDGLSDLSLKLPYMDGVDLAPLQALNELLLLDLDLSSNSRIELRPLAALERLANLNLDLTEAREIHLQPLAALKGLSSLDLALWSTSGSDLQPLAALDRLVNLNLDLTRTSDIDLGPLATLNGLASLTLKLGESSGVDLRPLAALNGLSTLTLELTASSVGNLQPLAALNGLSSLDLELTKTSGVDLGEPPRVCRRLVGYESHAARMVSCGDS